MNASLRNTFVGGSILYLLLGLCMVIWPTASKLVICYILGAVLILFGIAQIILYFSNREPGLPLHFGFIIGALCFVLCLVFVINPQSIIAIFGILIGAAITLDSIVKLQFALELRRISANGWVASLVASFITLILGILLFFNPFTAADAVTIFTGVCLIVDAIVNIWCVIDVNRLLR